MIDALIQEMQNLVNHTGFTILFLFCLLVFVIFFRHTKTNGIGVIIACLIVFICGLAISIVADNVLDKVYRKISISISLVSEREGILMQRYRLLVKTSTFMRFFSGVVVFCWTLWITSKRLFCHPKSGETGKQLENHK